MGDATDIVKAGVGSERRSSGVGSTKMAEVTIVENIVLEKKVGLGGSIGLVVGVIIGSGIFISPSGVASGAGSVGLSLLLWGVGGVVTMFAALSMAELGTMIPSSGGEFIYIKMAMWEWVSFLWIWTQCFLLKPASQAVVAITCAEYILVPIYQDDCGGPPSMYVNMLAAVIVLMVTVLNSWSVRLASGVQLLFTVAKILALVIIIIGGIYNMIDGRLEHLQTGFKGSNTNPGEIMLGLYSAMFAYDGWNNLNAVTEEVINPSWTLPMAMYMGIPLIVVLYMLTNVSYFTVMSIEGMLSSDAVAMTWANAVIPKVAWIIPMSVAMSTFGGVNGSFFSVGRLYYTAAREGHLPKILSYIQSKNLTPLPSLVVSCFFTVVYSLLGQVTALIDFLSFAIWMFYAVTMFVLMYFRFKKPFKDMPRPYKTPFIFPLIVFIFSVAMVLIPIITAPQIEFLYATVVMLAGFIFYFPFVYCKVKPKCMKTVTVFFQLLMEAVPPGDYEDEIPIDLQSNKSSKTD